MPHGERAWAEHLPRHHQRNANPFSAICLEPQAKGRVASTPGAYLSRLKSSSRDTRRKQVRQMDYSGRPDPRPSWDLRLHAERSLNARMLQDRWRHRQDEWPPLPTCHAQRVPAPLCHWLTVITVMICGQPAADLHSH